MLKTALSTEERRGVRGGIGTGAEEIVGQHAAEISHVFRAKSVELAAHDLLQHLDNTSA